jgi:hypothetical protein
MSARFSVFVGRVGQALGQITRRPSLAVVADAAGAVLTSDPLLVWLAPVLLFAAAVTFGGSFNICACDDGCGSGIWGGFRDL